MKYSPHLMPQIIGTMFRDLSSFLPKYKVKKSFAFLYHFSSFFMDIFDASGIGTMFRDLSSFIPKYKVKESFAFLYHLYLFLCIFFIPQILGQCSMIYRLLLKP